jgi:hypothetical protein
LSNAGRTCRQDDGTKLADGRQQKKWSQRTGVMSSVPDSVQQFRMHSGLGPGKIRKQRNVCRNEQTFEQNNLNRSNHVDTGVVALMPSILGVGRRKRFDNQTDGK